MASQWEDLAAVVIILSITLANVLALLQHDMKRFMAYSSISQAGYLILAVLGTPSQGAGAMAYYVAVYVVANLAVFGVISTVEQNCGGRTDREAYNGFYQTNPRLSLVMTAGLFSLAGIPRSPVLLQVHGLCCRFPCRSLDDRFPRTGKYRDLTLLLSSGCQGNLHHSGRNQSLAEVHQLRCGKSGSGNLPCSNLPHRNMPTGL